MHDGTKALPGDEIRRRLTSKGWTQAEFAGIIGRDTGDVSKLVRGKRPVTPEIASLLSAALGDEPSYWLGLEAERQAEIAPPPPPEVLRRVRAFEMAPIRQMKKRGWLPDSNDAGEIEAAVLRFFQIDDTETSPSLVLSARKSAPSSPLSREQVAWAGRAKQLAESLPVSAFSPSRVDELAARLRKIAAHPEEIHRVPKAMMDAGVRFVVVEPLSGGGIDGACFWLDESSPVVALSLRWDRVDAFWHTLFHELSHVRHGDRSVDAHMVGNDREPPCLESEIRADAEAADGLVPAAELKDFILRVQPFFSEDRIVRFANRIRMHPGVIVGQLQFRGKVKYSAHRKWLVKVRAKIVSCSLVDGWGSGLRNF